MTGFGRENPGVPRAPVMVFLDLESKIRAVDKDGKHIIIQFAL